MSEPSVTSLNELEERRLEHGGAIARARAQWGEPAEGWLDLSTGINPFAYPVADLPASVWGRLPDEDALESLNQSARAYYGVPPNAGVVAAAGSQSLIGALPFVLEPRRVAILGFTYEEHAYRWRLAKHDVRGVGDLSTALDADVIVVTNPNNPDGRVLTPHAILECAEILGRSGGLLVVDEAFCDVAPDMSMAFAVGMPGLFVLRSFGKFFGLAGLRLGFGLGETTLIQRIARFLGPWPVSGPALQIGGRALLDQSWISETRIRLSASSKKLEQVLKESHLEILGGTDLFKLTRSDQSESIKAHLGRSGILVRSFTDRPGWLRFGLPPDEAGYKRLAAAMMSRTIGKTMGNADT